MKNSFFEIKNKLTTLGIPGKETEFPKDILSDFFINAERLSALLPNEYINFLFEFGTLDIHDKEIMIRIPKEFKKSCNEYSMGFVNFYGLQNNNFNFNLLIERYKYRIPKELIPIGECPGGDQLCMGIKNKSYGKIYFWEHNKERADMEFETETWEPVNLLFSSFKELILNLEEQPIEENKVFDESIIEKIVISEKFLSRLKK